MNNKPKFYTKDNKPTKYALCCGYAYTKNGRTLTFIHGVYKVASLYDMQFFDTKKEALRYMST